MKKIIDILNEVSSTSKKLEKEQILRDNKNNDVLRLVLYSALNPFLVYHIKKIPDYTPNYKIDGSPLIKTINHVLPVFANRKVTGNNAIEKLLLTLESLHGDDAIVFERIIKKDLKIGCAASTVNKVWEGLIPKNCYMGAIAFDEDKFRKFPWHIGVFSQVKENGMFLAMEFGNDIIPLSKTRKGNELDFLGHFDNWQKVANMLIKQKYSDHFDKGIRLDGEILVKQVNSDLYEERSISNGIAGKSKNGKLSQDEADRLQYVVWDIVELESSYREKYDMPYHKRLDILKALVDETNQILSAKIPNHPTLVKMVDTFLCRTPEDAEQHYKDVISQGLEGTIIKHTDHVWKDGKPVTQMKLKVFVEVELIITAINESEKEPNKLGSFSCESSDGLLKVNVGSGYTKKQKVDYFNNQSLIGKVITTQFCEITQNSKGVYSFANPVFVEIRIDKEEADTFPEICATYKAKTSIDAKISGGK